MGQCQSIKATLTKKEQCLRRSRVVGVNDTDLETCPLSMFLCLAHAPTGNNERKHTVSETKRKRKIRAKRRKAHSSSPKTPSKALLPSTSRIGLWAETPLSNGSAGSEMDNSWYLCDSTELIKELEDSFPECARRLEDDDKDDTMRRTRSYSWGQLDLSEHIDSFA